MEPKQFTEEEVAQFERMWCIENVDNKFLASRELDDEEYIHYNIWKSTNQREMYEKHLPNRRVIIGKNPNVIFHGGCLGCLSQRQYGIYRCVGCTYFKGDHKPNLHIKGEERAKISAEDFRNLLRGGQES